MINYLKDARFYRKLQSVSYNAVSKKFYNTVYSHESVETLLAFADSAEFGATNMKGAPVNMSTGLYVYSAST